jgi:hypothetical protein
MPMIYVKAKPGTKLFYEGKPIPHDNFVPVNDDPFIRRLINHWGDLEVQDAKAPATPKSKPAAPAPAKEY